MQKLAQGTAERLVAQGIIRQEDVAIYSYGFEAIYSSLLELSTILLLSMIVGNFWQTVLFFVAFIPLRVYAGGYHASTRLRCYLTSLAVYGVFSLALQMIPLAWVIPFSWMGGVVSLFIVWFYAPVVHKNRVTGLQKRRTYRKISLIVCVLEVLLVVVGQCLWPNNGYIFAFFLGILAETMSMVIVKLSLTNYILIVKGGN